MMIGQRNEHTGQWDHFCCGSDDICWNLQQQSLVQWRNDVSRSGRSARSSDMSVSVPSVQQSQQHQHQQQSQQQQSQQQQSRQQQQQPAPQSAAPVPNAGGVRTGTEELSAAEKNRQRKQQQSDVAEGQGLMNKQKAVSVLNRLCQSLMGVIRPYLPNTDGRLGNHANARTALEDLSKTMPHLPLYHPPNAALRASQHRGSDGWDDTSKKAARDEFLFTGMFAVGILEICCREELLQDKRCQLRTITGQVDRNRVRLFCPCCEDNVGVYVPAETSYNTYPDGEKVSRKHV